MLKLWRDGRIDYHAALHEIVSMDDAASKIKRQLELARASNDWDCPQLLVVAALDFCDRRMVPVLAEILGALNERMTNEDVVELLGDIGDERAVPALSRALDAEFDFDEFHWLNVKAIWALESIGTKGAIEVIEKSVDSPFEEVRRAARDVLDRMRHKGKGPTLSSP